MGVSWFSLWPSLLSSVWKRVKTDLDFQIPKWEINMDLLSKVSLGQLDAAK